MIRRFINWILGECCCENPEPLQIAAEAGICNHCKRRLWGEDFNHWM